MISQRRFGGIEDKTFPLLKGDNRAIKGQSKWCTQEGCINLDRDGVVSNDDAFILPCSHAYVPRTPKSTPDVFIDNQLDPIFHDGAINELYRRLYRRPVFDDRAFARGDGPDGEKGQRCKICGFLCAEGRF